MTSDMLGVIFPRLFLSLKTVDDDHFYKTAPIQDLSVKEVILCYIVWEVQNILPDSNSLCLYPAIWGVSAPFSYGQVDQMALKLLLHV